MNLIIDLLIIFAAVAAVYLGIVRGFIRSVMHFSSLILALVAVFLFTAPVSEWLNDTFIRNEVTSITEESLDNIVNGGGEPLELETVISDRPTALTDVADRFSVDLDSIIESLTDSFDIKELAGLIAAPTADAISGVIAAIAVFILALIVLKLVTFILDMIFRLPVLDKLNTFLGFLFGVGSALVTAWIIANMSVGLITALSSINGDIFNQSVIDESLILRFFYKNSLIIF